MAVAQTVDEHIHGMHDVILHYVFGFKLPIGRFTYSGYAAIKDSRTFRVEAPLVGHTEKDTDTVAYISSGGKLTTIKMARGKPVSTVVGPWPGRRSLEPDLMDEWFRNCAGAMLTGVGSQVNPLAAFVKAATDPANHAKIYVEGRTVSLGDKKFPQYHIVCTKTDTTTIYSPAPPKSSSKPFDPKKTKKAIAKRVKRTTFYETVIDLNHMLPVKLNCVQRLDGKPTYASVMSPVDWYQVKTQKTGEKFNPKNFDPSQISFDQAPAH